VTEVVLQQSGVPIKYVGDGLLAFFSGAEHARRAIVASISAREVVTEPLVVGLAVGRAHLATIGHAEYARPDLLGRTVNCAFRVSAWAAANAEARIAIALEGARHLEQQFLLKPSSEVTLKGFAEPVQVSEVLGHITHA
jgi:class 3 adenylate cyclase